MDFLSNPYSTRRAPVMAARGMVATSQPLAAQAGLAMLQEGGNAVDAALATAIALTVVEPNYNGIGGDLFAQVWDGDKLHGLNASGRAPAGTSLESLAAAGHRSMPSLGWWPVTVPGAPKGWIDLHQRFGRLPFAKLFDPAIHYAEQGFLISPQVGYLWGLSAYAYGSSRLPEVKSWMDTFAPDGRAPVSGEMWRCPEQGLTLRRIRATNSEDFYEGDTAMAIARFARQTGGTLAEADLASHTSTWVEPISTRYRDHDVWEMPPNGQGIAALIALNILGGLDHARHPRDSAEALHQQIEALKLSLTDALSFVADPELAAVPVEGLLSAGYADARRALIGDRARVPEPGRPLGGGTVYLCATDGDGMMVSLIQSNYKGFGSGVVVPGTGIALHNRGLGFNMQQGHPNVVAPGKRPFHTIIPGFLTRDGQAVGPFGVMGGFMQAQGHVQMVVNTLDYGMNPQVSLDAPRWRWDGGLDIAVEEDMPDAAVAGLRARGHRVTIEEADFSFGRGQIIWRLPGGGYVAGSDKRADGQAVGY